MCDIKFPSARKRWLSRSMIAVVAGALVLPVTRALGQESNTPLPVQTVIPTRRTSVRSLKTPATLIADERVDLYAKISGYVSEINVDIGSRVTKGQLLAKISVPEMVEELRQAEAILKAKDSKVHALRAKTVQAKRMTETQRAQVLRFEAEHELDQINLDRKRELREGRAIPAQTLDEAISAHKITAAQLQIAKARVAGAEAEILAAEADVAVAESDVVVAQAGLDRLRTLMEYASIKAPFDGVVTMRHVDHGTFVRSAAEGVTTPLLRVSKIGRLRVVLEIPETDVPYVRAGTDVDVDIHALGGNPFPARVSRIAGALRPETRTMRVEVDIDNAAGRLAPGMYAKVVVKLESNAQAIVIPSRAIRGHGKNASVLVASNGVAKSMPITVGYDDGIWAEVLSGLDGRESVIVAARGAVTPGTAVQPVTPSGS